jgi:3-phosphoshikimate 1-carboxyvinyltransferase
MGSNTADWLVPRASGPVRARVQLPGSKSMTNRALVLSALADGETEIVRPLVARDTQLMADGLRALGCVITETADSWRVRPLARDGEQQVGADVRIDVGNAGTVLRFLPAVAALTSMKVGFGGDRRISERPVGPLLTALAELGAEISDQGLAAVPFSVHGRGSVRGGVVTLDASSSSQFISGLLLAAPRFTTGAEVRHHGPPLPSAPHIAMTSAMLHACGVEVLAAESAPGQPFEYGWKVFPGSISPKQFVIEPDLSNAVPFLAAALATGGEVTVAGWPADSMQPAGRIIEVLTAMGAEVTFGPAGLRVSGSGRISGLRTDLSAVGELTPVLTALAALASSPTEFTGIGHLRRHETDRLAALAAEIGKLGGDVTELADGLRIRPRPLRADGVVFDSHDDHRLVMAAAVLGLVTDGLRVHNAATVGKTFPGFSQYWATALAPSG